MTGELTVDKWVDLVAQLVGIIVRLFVAGIAATATGNDGFALIASFLGFYLALALATSIAVVTDKRKAVGR